METEIDILTAVRAALVDHDQRCDAPAKAVLLNRGNFELIGWDEVLGLPVLPDDRVAPMRVHVLCGVGAGGVCEDGPVYWDDDGRAYVKGELSD